MGHQVNPCFAELENPVMIMEHINSLNSNTIFSDHNDVLLKLLEQFQTLDFEILAFPQAIKLKDKIAQIESKLIDKVQNNEDITDSRKQIDILDKEISRFKLNIKHLLILSIENVLLIAQKNHWNICKNHDFIFLYNGAFWAEIDKDVFQKFLGEASEKIGVSMFSARFYQFREQLFKQFIATAYLPSPPGRPDTVLINLQNGTFHISPNATKLLPFNSDDFLTYQLPFKYDPHAKAPVFQKYLNRVLPDIESQNVLAEFIGYVFIKHTSRTLKEEKALILYGSGANGKSVFFDVVTALMGKNNTSNYTLQNLTEEKGFYRARIANKLLNYCSDISTKLDVALFKQLVSGEAVDACLKYGQPFSMTDYAKFIFNCNELPKDIEHTNAYFRRFLIIPFNVTIPENEQDKTLSYTIIDSELAGVFIWILDGLNRILAQKRFSHCSVAERALNQYKAESNSVKLFLDENNYKTSSEEYNLIKSLYPDYKSFCFEDGMKPFSKRNFIKQLENLGFDFGRQAGTGQKIVHLTNIFTEF